ncbi:prenyltransferase [bacterium]|nr:MAG: prenyltransferase [bacterium]
MIKNLIRALRLPFLSASVLPFVFGSLIGRRGFNLAGFIFGLFAVICAHLSANLINDWADSKSGVDSVDTKFYGFFGGSKLIQEGIFPESFYFKLALFFAFLALGCSVILCKILGTFLPAIIYLLIITLAWFYSVGPFSFSYRQVGEFVIFALFGPALVMGGYFIQTGIFPDLKSFILSLPFGFFTTAILFVNEVPDFSDDQKLGKNTWVGMFGPARSFILYVVLIACGFAGIVFNYFLGYLGMISFISFIFIGLAIKAAVILKNYPSDKVKLVQSSGLTIALQTSVSLVLIVSIIWPKQF